MSIPAAGIREFLQKPTRPAKRSRVAALLGLVSALLLASGQGLDKARSSEKAVSVERNLEVEEAAATLTPSRVRGSSGGASPPTGDESLVPEAPKGSIREAKAAGSMPAQEEDPRPDEKSSGRSSRRILARPDGTGTKSVAAAGSEKGHPAEEAGETVTVSYVADTEAEAQPIRGHGWQRRCRIHGTGGDEPDRRQRGPRRRDPSVEDGTADRSASCQESTEDSFTAKGELPAPGRRAGDAGTPNHWSGPGRLRTRMLPRDW